MIVSILTLLGCTGGPDRPPPPVYGTTPTDTFPQFYGQVPKNLVMISIDTFRRDHLDRYGGEQASPFLTTLAEAGVVLDDLAQCSNWTFASTSCTIGGRYNWEAGFVPFITEAQRVPWPVGSPFLATYLGDAGFYGVLASNNGWLSPSWGNTQGYDEAFHPSLATATQGYRDAREKLDAARREGRADRWFLHVHVVEPHAPYAPPQNYLDVELAGLEPAPWDLSDRDIHYEQRDLWPQLPEAEQALLEAHLRARYRAEVRYLDDQIFTIFQDLEVADLLDDAMIVVWTDHGEAFWEHGFHTHAFTLNAEENDAVGFIWSKNIVPATVTEPVSAIDLVPTLLDLWDLDVPPEVTGVPLSQRTPDRARFAWTVARLGSGQSVEQNGHKMTFAWSGKIHLYDTVTDPEELTDLYDPIDPPDVAYALWDELEPVVEAAQRANPGVPISWPAILQD